MALGLITTGCSLDQETIDAACTAPFTARIYENGTLSATATITDNSQLSSEIREWLKANSDDWHVSYDTFAPNIEIRNESMALNFAAEHAVLNVKNPTTKKWKQLIKKVDVSSLEFLKEIKMKAEPAA